MRNKSSGLYQFWTRQLTWCLHLCLPLVYTPVFVQLWSSHSMVYFTYFLLEGKSICHQISPYPIASDILRLTKHDLSQSFMVSFRRQLFEFAKYQAQISGGKNTSTTPGKGVLHDWLTHRAGWTRCCSRFHRCLSGMIKLIAQDFSVGGV